MNSNELLKKHGFTTYTEAEKSLLKKYPKEVTRLTEEGFLLVVQEYPLDVILEGVIPFSHYKISEHDMLRGDWLKLLDGTSAGTCIGSVYAGSIVKVV